MKERMMAIFVGLVMIGSIVGFAGVQFIPEQQNTGPDIPIIVNRTLTGDEIIFILRMGRVLIQNHYLPDCTECISTNAVLESFTNGMGGLVVLEEVEKNETKLQMVGSDGSIESLENVTITEENLMDIFCDISFVQPRECLLREL